MDFGSKLAQLRIEAHISQGALAEQCSVSHQTVSKWENGLAFPELSKIPLLCTIFSVTPQQLLSPTEEIPKREKVIIRELFPTQMGERIRRMRQDNGLSQEEFGERLNVSRQSVSRWETGQMMPETDTFLLMITSFSVSADSFFSIEDPVKENLEEMILFQDPFQKIRWILRGVLGAGLLLFLVSLITLLFHLD